MAGPHTWISGTGTWEAAGFDTGLLPADDEIVFMDGDRSNRSVTSGLDQNLVELKRLWTRPNYSGTLGVPGSPLIIGIENLIHQGTGTFFWHSHDSNAEYVVVDSANLVDAFHLVDGDTASVHLYLKSGGVRVYGDVPDILEMIIDGPDVRLTMDPSSDQFWSVWMNSGTVISERGQQAANIVTLNSGSWLQEGSTGQIVNLFQNGGEFIANGTASQPILFAIVTGGVLDFTQETSVKDIPILTIGASGEVFKTNEISHSGRFVDLRDEVPILP